MADCREISTLPLSRSIVDLLLRNGFRNVGKFYHLVYMNLHHVINGGHSRMSRRRSHLRAWYHTYNFSHQLCLSLVLITFILLFSPTRRSMYVLPYLEFTIHYRSYSLHLISLTKIFITFISVLFYFSFSQISLHFLPFLLNHSYDLSIQIFSFLAICASYSLFIIITAVTDYILTTYYNNFEQHVIERLFNIDTMTTHPPYSADLLCMKPTDLVQEIDVTADVAYMVSRISLSHISLFIIWYDMIWYIW